ncbi:MAG: biotin-dependent carboxyltransferase family protein, partial [Dokdonella sp.]
IGPYEGRALQVGDVLPMAPKPSRPVSRNNWSLDPAPWFDTDASQPIHCIAGRHHDALDAESINALERDEFSISLDSNRVGIRLDGPTLHLREPLELVSEPVNFGTIQLPPGGQLIALMAEHPTMGGYPRIAQIAAIDLGRFAQRRPGERVRLAWLSVEQAQARYLAQQRELANLIRAIGERS